MSFIEQFKILTKKLEYSDIIKEDYSDSNYEIIKKFLKQKLSSDRKDEFARELVDNMGLFLRYTNFYNMEWLNYEIIYTQPNFIKRFVESITSFRFKNNIQDLFQYLNRIDDYNFNMEAVFSDTMLNFLIQQRLSSDAYDLIFLYMSATQKQKFLELVVKNNVDVDVTYWIFKMTNENKEFVINNIPFFIRNSDVLNFQDMYCKDEKTRSLVKQYIDEYPMRLIEAMLGLPPGDTSSYKDLKEFNLELVKDICKNEKVKMSDIRRGVGGRFSKVFFIGNKVLKIGRDRGTKTFPNNPYILSPLLRREVELNGIRSFYEVTERVDTRISDENELYDLYKKVRDLGLIWTDVKFENAGRLLKDNVIHWREDLNPEDRTLGLEARRGNVTLKAGSLVIIDSDFIYRENEQGIFYPGNTYYDEFEAIYQAEKKRGDMSETTDKSEFDNMSKTVKGVAGPRKKKK